MQNVLERKNMILEEFRVIQIFSHEIIFGPLFFMVSAKKEGLLYGRRVVRELRSSTQMFCSIFFY